MPVEAGEVASPGVMELRKRLSGFETEEGRLRGLGFQCVPACPACAAFSCAVGAGQQLRVQTLSWNSPNSCLEQLLPQQLPGQASVGPSLHHIPNSISNVLLS